MNEQNWLSPWAYAKYKWFDTRYKDSKTATAALNLNSIFDKEQSESGTDSSTYCSNSTLSTKDSAPSAMPPKEAKLPKRVLRASGGKNHSSHRPNDSQRKKVSNSKKQKDVEDDLESNKDEEDEEGVLSETELGSKTGMNQSEDEEEENSSDDEESEANGKDAGVNNSNPSSTSEHPGGVPGTIVARRGSTTSTPRIAASVSRLCDSAEITERVKELESMEKEHLALKARLIDLERKERLGNVVTPSKSVGREPKEALSDDQKQMLTEVNYIMNTKVVRGVKFAKPGWSSYSTVPGTVCAMIMQDISLPVGTTEEEKKHIWNGFIKKALNRMLTQSKNKITQDLRGQFNGMPFDMLSVCMNYFYSDTIVVFPLAVEYGRPGALDTKALELYILKTHARDFLASSLADTPSAGSKLLVDAILNYARHAAPKEETRKLMIHSKGVVKRTFESEGVAQEDGEENYHISHLDLLTTSDLAYVLWQLFNSWPDWTNKQKNKGKAGINWTCKTRWTSNKSEGIAQEGVEMYDKLHKWCVTLKSLKGTDEYVAFRMFLNGKAKERGLIRDYGVEREIKKRRVEMVEEAPVVYDCDEFMVSVEI
jgi:hypothetical protein